MGVFLGFIKIYMCIFLSLTFLVFFLIFKKITNKILCKKKNKNLKRVFLENIFFNVVDIKSRVLFKRLTSNLIWAFGIYLSIVSTAGIAKLLLLLFLKKNLLWKKYGEKLTFFQAVVIKIYFLFSTYYDDIFIDQENQFYFCFGWMGVF